MTRETANNTSSEDESVETEDTNLNPQEENLRKLLYETCRRNPAYFNQLRLTVMRIADSYPAEQWGGIQEWQDQDLEEIFKLVQDRLLNGNLIRFWLSARTDSCQLRINLNNLVFNIIYSRAPAYGVLFHSHTADQIKRDPAFIKQTYHSKDRSRPISMIGLSEWNHQNFTSYNMDQLITLWRKEVRLPQFASAHNLKPAQRADIFRQMLELAGGHVIAKDFYHGYRIITGFSFNLVSSCIGNTQGEENGNNPVGSEFDYLKNSFNHYDAEVREKIRQSIAEGFDSWQPLIKEILGKSIETREFLKCYFLETNHTRLEAAAKLNKTPVWATRQLEKFNENINKVFSDGEVTEEFDQRAFVQLIIDELAKSDSGEYQP